MLISIKRQILSDLKKLGVSVDNFTLKLCRYSKTLYGRYFIDRKEIRLYLFMDKNCTHRFEYIELLKTVVHELTHHIQHSNPEYVRYSGVMHDPEFYRIYNNFVSKINNTPDIGGKFNEKRHHTYSK